MEYPFKLVMDSRTAWDGGATYHHAERGGAEKHLAELKASMRLCANAGVFVVNPRFAAGEASPGNPRLIPITV